MANFVLLLFGAINVATGIICAYCAYKTYKNNINKITHLIQMSDFLQ